MESCGFPRTVEEMLEAGWYGKLLRKVSKANLRDVLSTPEELVQDIFLQIIRSNYLEKYNPDYRPFDVYIYAVADNLIRKRGARERTNCGKKLVNSATIENAIESGEPEVNTVYLDTLNLPDVQMDMCDALYLDQMLESAKESLKQIKTDSKIVYEGQTIVKDPATVFEYILEGKSVSDIASIMHVSKQYIYTLIHRIRKVDSLKEFYEDAVRNNKVSKKVCQSKA